MTRSLWIICCSILATILTTTAGVCANAHADISLKAGTVIKLTYDASMDRDFATKRAIEISQWIWQDYCKRQSTCGSLKQFTISLTYFGDETRSREYCIALVTRQRPSPYDTEGRYVCGRDGSVAVDTLETDNVR
jgi:hypothetical protein